MFLKTAKVKGKEYIRIVKSYRDEEGKVKHKTIASLGSVDNLVNLLLNSNKKGFNGLESFTSIVSAFLSILK